MKKFIALFALLMTVGAGLCSIVSKIQPNNLLLSSLALSNLEALAQNENGLSDGWVQGRKMDQVWLVATASFSGGISAGSNGIVSTKVEGGVTSVKVSCCVLADKYGDACNKPKEHSECVNQLP